MSQNNKEQINEGNQLRLIKENQERIERNKPKKIETISEDRLQQECYMWFHNSFPELRGLLFHVPNGGSRNAIEGKKFKAIGVVAGVADLLFLYKGQTYFLELKTQTGTQSKVQRNWQEKVQNHYFNYFIIRSKSVFCALINEIVKR